MTVRIMVRDNRTFNGVNVRVKEVNKGNTKPESTEEVIQRHLVHYKRIKQG